MLELGRNWLMSEENTMPDWADRLLERIASNIEFKGLAEMEGYYSAPEDNEWGVHLLEMAPAMMEVMENGPNDGERVYGVIHRLDLLAIQRVLEPVATSSFGFENDGSPALTIAGEVEGREVTVIINALPFPDESDGDLVA